MDDEVSKAIPGSHTPLLTGSEPTPFLWQASKLAPMWGPLYSPTNKPPPLQGLPPASSAAEWANTSEAGCPYLGL